MENKLLQALAAHYNAKIHRAEANLMNYFNNRVGVGDHPDVVGEMTKLVDEISSARGALNLLDSFVQPEGGTESGDATTGDEPAGDDLGLSQ